MNPESSNAGPPAGDLSIGGLLRAAFATITDRPIGNLVAITGIWTAVLIAGQILILLGEVGNLPVAPDAGDGASQAVRPVSAMIADAIFSIVNIIAMIDIGVRWTRYLILDELPQAFLDARLNGRRWQLFVRWLLVATICVIAVIGLVGLPMALFGGLLSKTGFVLIFLAAWFTFVYISAGRLGLYLVGGALGDPRMTFMVSWRATQPVGLTLTLAVLAATLLFIAPYLMLLILFPVVAGASISLAIVLITPATVALSIAMSLVYQAIIALAYAQLVPEPAPGTLVL